MVGADDDLSEQPHHDQHQADGNEKGREEQERHVVLEGRRGPDEPADNHAEGDGRSEPGENQADASEEVDGLGGIVAQELHGQQVEQHLERSVDPILGDAELPRAMVDHNLGDASAGPRCVYGHKPVHLAVEPDVADDLCTIGFEAAPVIVEFDAGPGGDEPVGEDRRESPAPEEVLPRLAPAADDVEPLIKFGDQAGDVCRVVLKVGVERNEDVAGRVCDGGCERRGLPKVLTESDNAAAGIGGCDGAEHLKRAVGRAVIDEHNLDIEGKLLRHGVYLPVQQPEVLLLVEHGNEQRQFHGNRSFARDADESSGA